MQAIVKQIWIRKQEPFGNVSIESAAEADNIF